jgi:uncharacterized membrane protein YccC
VRALIWLAAAALLVVGAAALARVYETMPSGEAVIIVGSAVFAAVAVFVAVVVAWAIYEAREERRYREAGDDAEAYLAPLRTGSRSAERAMLRFHREHGLLLLKRTSDATRRLAAAVDRTRRPGWMLRRRPMRRPVFGTPAPASVVEPELEPLPGPAAAPDPDLHAAPVPDTADQDLQAIEATLSDDGEDSPWAPDSTMWGRMRDELFAMLNTPAEDVEVAS